MGIVNAQPSALGTEDYYAFISRLSFYIAHPQPSPSPFRFPATQLCYTFCVL